jgi:hypothetical protein
MSGEDMRHVAGSDGTLDHRMNTEGMGRVAGARGMLKHTHER